MCKLLIISGLQVLSKNQVTNLESLKDDSRQSDEILRNFQLKSHNRMIFRKNPLLELKVETGIRSSLKSNQQVFNKTSRNQFQFLNLKKEYPLFAIKTNTLVQNSWLLASFCKLFADPPEIVRCHPP